MNLLDLARSALPVAAKDPASVQPDRAARRWQVHFPNLDPMEVLFSPAAKRAEVEAMYPGAIIEPLPDPTGRNATSIETAELRGLIGRVFGDTSGADRVAILPSACADPGAALTSFRALADARATSNPGQSIL